MSNKLGEIRLVDLRVVTLSQVKSRKVNWVGSSPNGNNWSFIIFFLSIEFVLYYQTVLLFFTAVPNLLILLALDLVCFHQNESNQIKWKYTNRRYGIVRYSTANRTFLETWIETVFRSHNLS